MESRNLKWHKRFLEIAVYVSSWSKDPKCQVGAVVVTPDFRNYSSGYNGFPRGIADTEKRLSTDEIRRALTIHAERNALDNARFDVRGCTIYSTKFPCVDCAKGIIQRGLSALVAPDPEYDCDRWGKEHILSKTILAEANIKIYSSSSMLTKGKGLTQ